MSPLVLAALAPAVDGVRTGPPPRPSPQSLATAADRSTGTTNTISAAASLALPTVEAPLQWRELQGHLSQPTPACLSHLGRSAAQLALYVGHRAEEFPYNLAPELSHDNLWSTQPLAPDRVQLLLEGFLPGRELLWWENPTVLQSVPGVSVHVWSLGRR
ncbi:MAG: hypothetical protein WDW36_008930 [Sanguina aurantia]